MQQSTNNQISLNHGDRHHFHLICWHSVLSGLFVAVFFYTLLSALGLGIGGLTAAHVIDQNENGSGLLTGSAIWLGVSAVVSLFLGGYFSTRFSGTRDKQAGVARGAVICALFFILVLSGIGNMVGSLAGLTVAKGLPNGSSVDAEASARAIGEAGWLIFTTSLLGFVAAVFGGYEGVVGNLQRPFASFKSNGN